MSTPVEPIVVLLERIAVALEKLAEITPDATLSPPPAATTSREFANWARVNGLKGTRAIRVLWRGNFRSLDMLNKEALLQCDDCGETTAQRILAWKDSFAK